MATLDSSSPQTSPELPQVIRFKPSSSADKPILLPTQRKLRHIRGLLCRNVSLQPPVRARSSTQDDDTLRTSWQSPSKLWVQTNGPHTSMSSSDLQEMAKRPAKVLRRRSTRVYPLGALEDTVFRQKRWEKVVETKLVDIFFTIHRNRTDEPLYISEQLFQTMNPNFACFDFLNGDDDTLRLNTLIIRVYAKPHTSNNYTLLIEHDIALCCLQFIGKDIGHFHHPFPMNSIVIQLTDGYYTAFNDVVTHDHPLPTLAGPESKLQTTCSYSTMLKLATIEDVIRDTIHSREEIKSNIERLLSLPNTQSYTRQISESKQSVTQIQSALQSEKKRLQLARKKAQSLRTSIQLRKESMHKGLQVQAQAQNHLLESKQLLQERKSAQEQLTIALSAQRRRIGIDLQAIYPIDPMDDETLRFKIRGVRLPATGKFEGSPEEEVATALGWTAHLVYLLSLYLCVPLRYPVQPIGGRSLIKDPVSIMMGSRTFPLYASGDQHRFDYAVFLLNKDIEQLMNSQLLHVMDLRSTLANLKYLLLYLTATTSAMLPPPPARGRRAEAIPVKKVLGIFDSSGGVSSAASSVSGNGNAGSFRTGFGRFFGGSAQSSQHNGD